MSDHNEPTGHACPSCGQIYARENIIEAKDAEIERLRKMISVDTDLLCEKEAEIEKLQALVRAIEEEANRRAMNNPATFFVIDAKTAIRVIKAAVAAS